MKTAASMLALSLLLAGCTSLGSDDSFQGPDDQGSDEKPDAGNSEQEEAPGSGPTPEKNTTAERAWNRTLSNESILVRVVAPGNWTIEAYGPLNNDTPFYAGVYVLDVHHFFRARAWGGTDVMLMTESIQVKEETIPVFANIPEEDSIAFEGEPGTFQVVLSAHWLEWDFVIDSAQAMVIHEDRDMVRKQSTMDGEWDYGVHVQVPGVVEYFEGSRLIESKYNYTEIEGVLMLPPPHTDPRWDVETIIGDHACNADDYRIISHTGSGDLFIKAQMEKPDRWGRFGFYVFDLPIETPKPECNPVFSY